MPIQKKQIHILCTSLFFLFGCVTQPHAATFSPYGIYKNQSHVVMPVFTPFTHAQTIEHTVGPSETLWRISKTYGVSIDTLMRVNGLHDPSHLEKGQVLIIPKTMGPRPVIPLYPTNRWTHIVIHHTATDEGNAFSIDRIHHKRGFWNGLGYHFLINNGTGGKMDGQIEVGPRWIKQMDGAHANTGNMNKKGIGIALMGNFSETKVSARQFDALVYLARTLQNYYDIPYENIIRHSDVPGKNTECPGTYFPWQEFKQRL